MGKQILSTYEIILERDTSQTYTFKLQAYDEAEATNKAIDIAHDDNVEWQESDFLGDPVVSFIGVVLNEKAGQEEEVKEVFNITNEPPSTNVDVVTDIMTFSNHGALAQMFVIDAVVKFSKIVMDTPSEEMAMMDNGLVSCAAWKAVAKEINDKLARYRTGDDSKN